MIRVVHLRPGPDFFTYTGSRGQKCTGSLIRIRNTDKSTLFSPASLVTYLYVGK
jgi:hypothetical protein